MAERIDQPKNTPTTAEIAQAARRILDSENELAGIMADASRVRGEISGVYRSFKKNGGNKVVLRERVAELRLTPEEIEQNDKDRHEYSVALGIKRWVPGLEGAQQMPMFGDDVLTVEERARMRDSLVRSDAANTAREGGTEDDCPHADAGSRDFQTWMTEFKRVKSTMTTDLGERASATPARRGRRKATATADDIGETAGNA